MSFGLEVKGHNNSLLFSSGWSSLAFVGKAAWTGANSFFPADHQSYQWRRNFGPFGAGIFNAPISGTGVKQFFAHAETFNCGYITVTFNTPDDNGCFEYEVYSPGYPTIFVNTTNTNVSAIVLGVYKTGVTNASGWYKWIIKLGVGYPSGLRSSALTYLSLYCFSNMYDTVGSYGLKVWNENSNIVFNSEVKPVKVQDIVTITSTTLSNPSDLSTLVFNKTTLANPKTSVYSVPKPAFLNLDWARYNVDNNQYAGVLNRLAGPPTQCVFLTQVGISYSQKFLAGGLRVNSAGSDLILGLFGLDITDGVITASTSNTDTVTKTELLPINIPVINGSDYD
jgi:hypothetical protein